MDFSTLERAQLNFENYVGAIEYFFSERKHDLFYITNSNEITSYFLNKSLGMSEAYGLKLNAYLVKKMLKTNIDSKVIQEKRIYDGFMLFDINGKVLVEIQKKKETGTSQQSFLTSPGTINNVSIQVSKSEEGNQIILRSPCSLKGEKVGELVVFLNFDTFSSYFLNTSSVDSSNYVIVHSTGDEKTIIFHTGELLIENEAIIEGELFLDNKSTKLQERTFGSGPEMLLVAQQNISNTPFKLIFVGERKQLIRQTVAWKIVTGVGGLIILVVSLFTIIQFRIKNTILHSNLIKIENQQAALANKNAQLQEEIEERKETERQKRKIENRLHQAQKMEGIGQLAAGIAHDLNNILSGIVSLPQLLGCIRRLWNYLTTRSLFSRETRLPCSFFSYSSKKVSNLELYLAHRSFRILLA